MAIAFNLREIAPRPGGIAALIAGEPGAEYRLRAILGAKEKATSWAAGGLFTLALGNAPKTPDKLFVDARVGEKVETTELAPVASYDAITVALPNEYLATARAALSVDEFRRLRTAITNRAAELVTERRAALQAQVNQELVNIQSSILIDPTATD